MKVLTNFQPLNCAIRAGDIVDNNSQKSDGRDTIMVARHFKAARRTYDCIQACCSQRALQIPSSSGHRRHCSHLGHLRHHHRLCSEKGIRMQVKNSQLLNNHGIVLIIVVIVIGVVLDVVKRCIEYLEAKIFRNESRNSAMKAEPPETRHLATRRDTPQ